ncbi:bone marrow stromal antigen 2 isoform X1 [Pteropus alecto]|uniref:Bone marrow stromal antigen 2 n=1 Tax=Pteropus alecto TaxID=9402 RepID=L5L6U1_PTEAL|nr:bone marrow stromal antigen 2 isoform X1 [Pteropus alecto]ELK19155.1 Bone marrow stromal antigen 2 [Pteropus alecto]
MAPTLYHYFPVPMDDHSKKVVLGNRNLPRWLWILLVLVILGLTVAVIVLAVENSSEACKNGLQAEQKCRNKTHLLELQLTQTQESLGVAKAQAASCNQTVGTLKSSLEMEKAESQKQRELAQKLQGEITNLTQQLKNTAAELEQLRKEHASGEKNGSTSSRNARSSLVVVVLLSLSFRALLA